MSASEVNKTPEDKISDRHSALPPCQDGRNSDLHRPSFNTNQLRENLAGKDSRHAWHRHGLVILARTYLAAWAGRVNIGIDSARNNKTTPTEV